MLDWPALIPAETNDVRGIASLPGHTTPLKPRTFGTYLAFPPAARDPLAVARLLQQAAG